MAYKEFKNVISKENIPSITQDLHSLIRNNIITEIVIHNATRTGSIVGLNTSNFNRAMFITERNAYTVKVTLQK